MDDIVQLNGYYQYSPQLKIALDIQSKCLLDNPQFNLLQKLIERKPIRKIMEYATFSDIMEIPLDDVLETLVFLKSMGYEVRNHKTNPQINKGSLLIPYIFPTLTNLSVQLRKEL